MNNFINTPQLNNRPTRWYLILAIMFLLIGTGIIIGISVNEGLKSAKLNRYIIATGTVVDYEVYETNYNNSNVHKVYAYAEIAEFEVDGIKYTVTNSVGSTYPTNDIGDPIKIAYNPEDPLDCVFIAQTNKIFTIILALFSVLFTVIGLILLIYYIQQYKEWKKRILKTA